VAEEISRQSEPVLLVGHSLGGISISAAAERVPDRVRLLVYLCAFILRDGESLYTFLDPTAPADSVPPKGSSWDIPSSPVPGEGSLNNFYNGCPADSIALARARLRPQPTVPRITPISLSDERYGRIPRAYVECTDDQAVSIDLQRRMVARSPCEPVLSLPTGHSPFFAAPGKLADALASLA
jgi:pimeloyl-ACP methyl ester carboxylesterase